MANTRSWQRVLMDLGFAKGWPHCCGAASCKHSLDKGLPQWVVELWRRIILGGMTNVERVHACAVKVAIVAVAERGGEDTRLLKGPWKRLLSSLG